MANKKFLDFPELIDPAIDDVLLILDRSDSTDSIDGSTKHIKKSNLGGGIGKISLEDALGTVFTSLLTARAYVQLFTSATITDESFSGGIYRFTVPTNSQFSLINGFCSSTYLSAQNLEFKDPNGLVTGFLENAFYGNTKNNVLGVCAFSHAGFDYSTGDNFIKSYTGNNSQFEYATGNNYIEETQFSDAAFTGATPSVKNTIKNLNTISGANFGVGYVGQLEILNKVGATNGQDFNNNFFLTSPNAWISVRPEKLTSNAGGLDGDLARAKLNGAKIYTLKNEADSGGSINVIKDAVPSINLHGTTVETILKTYLLKANTYSINDIMEIVSFRGNGFPATTLKLYLNNTPDLVSTQVGYPLTLLNLTELLQVKKGIATFTITDGIISGNSAENYPTGIDIDLINGYPVDYSPIINFDPTQDWYFVSTGTLWGAEMYLQQVELLIR